MFVSSLSPLIYNLDKNKQEALIDIGNFKWVY